MSNSSPIPINTERLKDEDCARIVTELTVLGIPAFPEHLDRNYRNLVHWRMQLRWPKEDDPGELSHASVCLDTQRMSQNDARVEVELRSRPDVVSQVTRRGKYWEYYIDVKRVGLTVQRIIEHIFETGRNRYRYDRDGSGCLYWTRVLLGDFQEMGWIGYDEPGEFDIFPGEPRDDEEGEYWIPSDQGIFY